MIWLAVLVHPILLVEGLRVFVAAQLHLFYFLDLPTVHLERSKGRHDSWCNTYRTNDICTPRFRCTEVQG